MTTTDLDTIRRNADKAHAKLTDYRAGIEPSLLYQAIYLTEAEARLGRLAPDVRKQLGQVRKMIREACGIR